MARRCPYVCHASATIPPTICPRRRPSCTMVLWNVSTSRCTRRYPARDKTNTVTAKTTSTSLKVSFTVSTTHCSSILSKPSIFYNNIRVQVRYQAQSDAYRRSINTDSVAASPGLLFTVQGESWKVRWGSVGERQNAPFETAPGKGEALCRGYQSVAFCHSEAKCYASVARALTVAPPSLASWLWHSATTRPAPV